MVPAQQHVGHIESAPRGWLRVDGAFEQAGHGSRSEGVIDDAVGIAEHTGYESDGCLDHDEDGGLSPGQDVVTHRHLTHPGPVHARGVMRGHAGIDALVPPAREDQPRRCRPLLRKRLAEGHARRRRDHEGRSAVGIRCGNGVQCLAPRLGAHDHAGATAVRRVVDRVVLVMREGAQVVDPKVDEAGVDRLPDK